MKDKPRLSSKKIKLSRIRTNQKSSRKTRAASKASATQKSAGVNRSEGIRLFQLAGRPTKEQFIRVYGEQGPKMTWAQRAAAGVPAEKFQSALAPEFPLCCAQPGCLDGIRGIPVTTKRYRDSIGVNFRGADQKLKRSDLL